MKKVLFLLAWFLPYGASAELLPVITYKTVQCELLIQDKVVEMQRSMLITLMDEDRIARFTQITWRHSEIPLQYQLLVEEDLKNPGSLIFLQNFLVDSLESSAEFSANQVRWVRVRQGDYAVVCEINPKPSSLLTN